MNRIDRLMAILIFLQSRRLVTAADIAERFSISLRTVYRDVKALEESGVPLAGEAEVGFGLRGDDPVPRLCLRCAEAHEHVAGVDRGPPPGDTPR